MIKRLLRFIQYFLGERRFFNNINRCHRGRPRALISYTVFPFLNDNRSHANYQESSIIVDLFDQLGFQVDVIHYTNQRSIDYSVYDVIFGFGEPFEKSFVDSRCKAIRFFYATGAHVFHQNPAEAKRIVEFNAKYGVNLLPKRLVPSCWTLSSTFSDYLIVIGNDWTSSTYTQFTDKPVFAINATAILNKKSISIERNLSDSRTNFLWFGSSGLVHKGLDLCLEYFAVHPEYTLHICGPQELEFFRTMQIFLTKPNVIYHGFVDVASDQFIEITSRCLFTILPSCSEGQATALLTAMGTGLIPIGSRYTGIDIDRLGYLICRLEPEAIGLSIQQAQSRSDETLQEQSKKVMNYIYTNHTCAHLEINLGALLRSCLSPKSGKTTYN